MVKKCGKWIATVMLSLVAVIAISVLIPQTAVVAEAKEIKLSDTSLELMPGEYYQMSVKNAGAKKVTWETSDKKVVTITAKGKVHAVGNGGERCTLTATVDGKTMKCTATIRAIQEYKNYIIWLSNWTYSGYDINGKALDGVVPGYMQVFKYKGCYYYVIESEGDSETNAYVANDYSLEKIGKQLPSFLKKPMYAVFDKKGIHLSKNKGKNQNAYPAVNILCDAKGKLYVEKACDYSDKQWKVRAKQLGY